MRHFLKFIGAYEKWDVHGFKIKVTSFGCVITLDSRGLEVADAQ